MKKTQNNKLPKIMLPIAMIVASLVSSAPITVFNVVYPILVTNLGIDIPSGVFSVVNNAALLIGSIGYVVVLILFSLSCKGLQKKLCFVMSAYVGAVANVFTYICSFITALLVSFLPLEPYIISTVFGLGNSVGSITSVVIGIVVAVLFFHFVSAFTEKETSEEESEPYKVKLLKPSLVVVGYGVFSLIVKLVSYAITTAVSENMIKGVYAQIAIPQAINVATHIIVWAALIGGTFLFKDKYQKFTIVGSIIAGNNIAGFVGITLNFITIFLPNIISGVVSFFSSGITTVLGIVLGILIFYITNKKQYEKIKK